MADIVERYVLKGDTSDASASLQDFQKSADKSFKASAKSAVIFSKALDAGIALLGQLKTEFVDGVKAALVYEQTNLKLAASLRTMRGEGESSIRLLNQQSAVLQELTGVSDDTIREFQAMAVQFGVSTTEIDKYIRAASIAADVTGADMRTAFTQLIKAQSGVAEETLRMIPAIREMTREQLENGDAVGTLLDLYGDQLGATMTGAAGAVTNLGNSWDDLTEAIGRSITESKLFQDAVNGLKEDVSDLALIVEEGGLFEGLGAIVVGTFAKPLVQKRAEGIRKEREASAKADEAQVRAQEAEAARAREAAGLETGKKGGSKKGRPAVEIDLRGAQEEYYQQEADAAERLAARKIELEEKVTAYKQEQAERRFEMAVQISNEEADFQQAQLDEAVERGREAAEKEAANMIAGQREVEKWASIGLRSITNSLVQMAETGEFSAERLMQSLVSAIGQALIAEGVKNLAMAAGFAFIPGMQGNAGGLAAVGALQVTAGMGLAAVGGRMNKGIESSASAFGGGGQSSNADFGSPGGNRPGQGRYGSGGGGDRTVTIVVPNVLAPEEAGYRLAESLRSAQRQGLV